MSPCSVEGCEGPHYGKGLCSKHYQRLRRHGDPATSLYDRTSDLASKFWRNVEQGEGCWCWTGSTDSLGYGVLYHATRFYRAHRVSWELANRSPIPDGLIVCHRCDNPPCVRPDHLFTGTDADNSADRDRKGRQVAPRGEASGMAKLNEEAVREIRRLASAGETKSAIARRFGVTRQAVGFVLNGKTWVHVT